MLIDYATLEPIFAFKSPEELKTLLRTANSYNGWLYQSFREVYALQGVKQPVEHHPEGDAFEHTVLVVEQGAKLADRVGLTPTQRASFLFAVLLHDIGKGKTPVELQPKHHGHEEVGAEMIVGICQRLNVPKEVGRLAYFVTRDHGKIHKCLDWNPKTFVKYFQEYKESNVNGNLIAMASEADSRGRLGFEDREYPQASFLRFVFGSLEYQQTKDKNADYKTLLNAAKECCKRLTENRQTLEEKLDESLEVEPQASPKFKK